MLNGGFGAEIAARIGTELFDELDAPVVRVGCPFAPIPFAPGSERALLPGSQDIVRAVRLMPGLDDKPQEQHHVALVAQEIPKIGLVMDAVKVVRWLKNVGDSVRLGEPLVEVETEKSIVEIEATASGRLAQILVQVDQEATVGDRIAWIESDQAAVAAAAAVRADRHARGAARAVAAPSPVRARRARAAIASAALPWHVSSPPNTALILAPLPAQDRAGAFSSRMSGERSIQAPDNDRAAASHRLRCNRCRRCGARWHAP